MSTKNKMSPSRLTIPRKSAKKVDSQFQSKSLFRGSDVFHMSPNMPQDGDFSPVDDISVSPNLYDCGPNLSQWLDEPGLMSSGSSCTSESTEESFDVNSMSKADTDIQDPQLYPYSPLSHTLLPSSSGQNHVMDHSGNYHSEPHVPHTADAGNSPQLAYNNPQAFQNILFSIPDNDGCQPNRTPQQHAEDAQSIVFNPHEMDDTEMFTASTAWENLAMGNDDFSSGTSNLSSMFNQVPVTPPLTEPGNDASVTSHMGYPQFARSEDSALVDLSPSLPAQGLSLGDPFFPVSPALSGQDPNRLVLFFSFDDREYLKLTV